MKRRNRLYLLQSKKPVQSDAEPLKQISGAFEKTEAPAVEYQVKEQIIICGAIIGENPATLNGKLKMIENLQYDDNKFALLCPELQDIVARNNPTAVLSCDDLSEAEKVSDVVDLVKTTIAS